jgi:hypothetical protein
VLNLSAHQHNLGEDAVAMLVVVKEAVRETRVE